MKLKYDLYEPDIERANPVVLVHSMLESRKTWIHVAPIIASSTGRKVYAPDARNHGESPWSNDYTLKILVEDLEEFLDDHNLRRIVVLGHSLGGRVAIAFALKKPDRVEKLIVEDSTPKEFTVQFDGLVPVAMDFVNQLPSVIPVAEDIEEVKQWCVEAGLKNNFLIRASPDAIKNYDFNMLPFKWTGNTFKILLNLQCLTESLLKNKLSTPLSGTYDGQVLVLFGERSQFKLGTDSSLQRFFPNVVKVAFPNVGHFIHHDIPKEFSLAVCDFINTTGGIKSKF